MQLRDAMTDVERDDESDRFPGERRTTRGRFTGTDGRLVHVSPDGRLRDFGYPLSGLTGLDRSRFGLLSADRDGTPLEAVAWFDADADQQYVDGTTLVETTHAVGGGTVRQYDLSVGDAHLTRFETSGFNTEPTVLAYLELAPDGRGQQVGQLRFDDAVEVYHGDEHDFLASSTGLGDVYTQPPATPEQLLEGFSSEYPRDCEEGQYEASRLSGGLLVTLPVGGGAATLGTLLTDAGETGRETAIERLERRLERADSVASLTAGGEGAPGVLSSAPGSVAADLRVLSLLAAESGLRMAGPDFDPHYYHSGGYGYTWFRDDAEIAGFLLSADERFGLGLADAVRRNAAMYCRTQLPDGSWPHRVWPRDGSLAPGWANSRIERGTDEAYQADQTASVLSVLAALRERGLALDGTDRAIALGVESLDSSLGDDGRPVACQNAWEDAVGRFSHTAAAFLEAYASVAATDHPDADRALAGAEAVYDAIDDLWIPDRGAYAMCETAAGDLDERYDSASLALVSAHRAYDEVGTVDDGRLDRLTGHVESVVDGLFRDPSESDVAGLARYGGDDWRADGQTEPKVWTVSTGLAANAAVELAVLCAGRDDDRAERLARRGRELFALVAPGGPLCEPTGYLPEQYFDDGTPDSATPLGWSHAIRLATVALAEEYDHVELATAGDGG